MPPPEFETLLEEAKRYFSSGYDEVYVANQFAEKGVEDATIDRVINELKKLNKIIRRNSGKKMLLYGLSLIVLGLGFIWWSSYWAFNYRFFLWGLPIAGFGIGMRGLAKILNI